MSEDYYYIEEISQNASAADHEKINTREKKSQIFSKKEVTNEVSSKISQEIRLHEIEQQLEMAESKCNTLKGQVDFMKLLYNGMDKEAEKTKNQKPGQTAPKRHLALETHNVKRKAAKVGPKGDEIPKEVPSRDVELKNHTSNMSTVPHRDINTKDASDTVKSINNIISGITNSVNRLTQLQVHIGSSNTSSAPNDPVMGIQTVKCAPRDFPQSAAAEKPYQMDPSDPKENKSVSSMKSKAQRKPKKKTPSCKLSTSKQSSSKQFASKQSSSKHGSVGSVDLKKKIKVTAKHVEKKTKLVQPTTLSDLRRKPFGRLKVMSSRTVLAKKAHNADSKNFSRAERREWKSNKLIELYHNSAAKIVTSDESLPTKKQSVRDSTKESGRQTAKEPERVEGDGETEGTGERYKSTLSPIEEQERVYQGSFIKNYELPTIASKMKQVARSYFQNFSFRTIPFVVAKSTTPSHNLGVNIQQVLSIIKGRKPVAGISPTLAYNIELAANKLGSRPLSALVSTLGSRMTNSRYPCPLVRRYPNYAHLQEMAKEIPEETLEELAATFEEDDAKMQQGTAMAAGDKEEKVWCNNPEDKKDQCTCLPKQGVAFADVYTKYREKTEGRTPMKDTAYSMQPRKLRSKPWNSVQKSRTFTVDDSQINQPSNTSHLNRREKSLKEILKNLHDEFTTLNDRYDDLKMQVSNEETNADVLQELEKLEKEVQNKEDEITMVMSLYNEVLSLKHQVKILKKRASQSSVMISPYFRAREHMYKDMNVTGHLTKLLRHIQQFQDTLKNKSTV